MKRFCKWCLKVKIMNHRDRQYRNILGVRLCRGAARSDATVEMRMICISGYLCVGSRLYPLD
jgi:hypothetical protein